MGQKIKRTEPGPLWPAGLAGPNFGVAEFEWAGGKKRFVLRASKSRFFERLLDPGCALPKAKHRT
jgi:hypothetical protein